MRWGWEEELWLPAELLRLLSSPAVPSPKVTFSYPHSSKSCHIVFCHCVGSLLALSYP